MLGILIIIDGCNEDYIHSTNTPFLYKLKKTSSYIHMKVTPSFATRVELFTGKSPETTDTFVDFCLGSSILPLRLFRLLKHSDRIDFSNKIIIPNILRKYLQLLKHNILKKHKNTSILTIIYYVFTGIWVDFANIPLSLLPYFSANEPMKKYKLAEKKGIPNNLIGILKNNGFKVNLFHGKTEFINSKILRHNAVDNEFIIIHYEDTDYVGHQYGPHSREMHKTLGLIDISIKNIYEQFESKLDLIVIFGDHDMTEVTTTINLWEKLQNMEVRLIKDYLVFINSPLARFWFKNKRAELEIRALLASLHEYGKEVTKKELKQNELPVNDKYGELIFWANKGVNFSPDFYNSSKIKGMHGYFDNSAKTPLIIRNKNNKIKTKGCCKMRDLTPTILHLSGIKYSNVDGESMLINNLK